MKEKRVYHNPSVNFLINQALKNKEVILSSSGAIVVYTGKYTGRSPNDKFIVDTPDVHEKINWGKVNVPIKPENYHLLYKKISNFFLNNNESYAVDVIVGADKKYSQKVRIFCEYAYQALFVSNLFRKPNPLELINFKPDLTLYCAPSVLADPKTDHTNSEAFIVLNISEKTVIIGGTKYAGEIKKSVFTYMNYFLPEKGVFPMHCSANIEPDGKTTALFFGLSGTGKTTLSADPKRRLIGDDEHGWSENGVFNFEGGCYAKCINIKKESEPQIWSAIHRKRSLLENVVVTKTGDFDFDSDQFTENTRAAYPLQFIKNSVPSGTGKHPNYILFLTADASGVLPPVAHLTLNQAAYHFLSGYTSKLAGTERGIKEPKPTFSAFFGNPFMPLKPMVYLKLLRKYLKKYDTRVYLVNTGWIGGPYGVGKRIPIKETRTIVTAILNGMLDNARYRHDQIFNLLVPYEIVGVDHRILNPANLWTNGAEYLKKAKELARLFVENLKRFSDIDFEVTSSGPKL